MSHKIAMDKRLLKSPERQWAMPGGSFRRSTSITWVVCMRVPPGWIMLTLRFVWVFGDAGALDFSSVKVAAVSINAVRSRLYGFAQPVSSQM